MSTPTEQTSVEERRLLVLLVERENPVYVCLLYAYCVVPAVYCSLWR